MTAAVVRGGATAAEKQALAQRLAAAQATPAPPATAPAKPAAAPTSPTPAPAAKPQPTPAKPAAAPTAGGRALFGGGSAASSAGGFVLALLVWSWVLLPLVKGGPQGVRNMLRAKFTNRAPDGSWLP